MNKSPENSKASRTAMASTKADLRELKTNSSATVQELQEFLRQLRGKSPREMLGVVATSQLFRATILSTILVTVGIFGLTAFTYFLGDDPAPTAAPVAATPAEPSHAAPVPTPEVTKPDAPDPIDQIDPLGVNDQLPAPPNKNPLEDKGGNFLDDLE